MAGLSAVHLSADYALCVLDGDSSFAVLHKGDQPDDRKEHDDPDDNEDEVLRLSDTACRVAAGSETPDPDKGVDGLGKSGYDAREQQDRNTVAYAVLVDLLAEPHHERGTRGEHQNDDYAREDLCEEIGVNGINKDVLIEVVALVLIYRVEQIEIVGCALDKSEADGRITCDRADLASARLAFLGKTLKSGDGNAEQLDDDRAVDVRGDTHGEQGGV